MPPGLRRRVPALGQLLGVPRHPRDPVRDGAVGVAVVERGRVVPPLGEGVEHVRDGRTADLRHRVVPRRGLAVPVVEGCCLRVAGVGGVVAPAVAQVDAADERDVLLGSALAAHDEELLVVRAALAHPLVEQRLAAALVDDPAEVAVLLAVEPARVGAPHQRPHLDVARGRVTEQLGDGRPVLGQPLVGVAAPVGEEDAVAGRRRLDQLDEAREVGRAVHAGDHQVAGGPGALRLRQEPLAHPHRFPAPGVFSHRATLGACRDRALSTDSLGAWLVKASGAAPSTREHVRAGFAGVETWCVRPTYRTDLVAAGQPVLLWVSGSEPGLPAGIHAHGRTTGPARDGVMPMRPGPARPAAPALGARRPPGPRRAGGAADAGRQQSVVRHSRAARGARRHVRGAGPARVRSCHPVFTAETFTDAAHNMPFLGSSA